MAKSQSFGQLRVASLRCNGQTTPLAVGGQSPRFSWRLESTRGDVDGQPLKQAAYRVRVAAGQDMDTAAELWDSGRIESGNASDAVYDGLPLRGGDWAWWSVRVWDQDGNDSGWAEPAFFEVGPTGRQDFAGDWIGPSENLFSDPLPAMGEWITPDGTAGEGDRVRLRGRFTLPDGYPRCFAMAWIVADPRCRVSINGRRVKVPQPFGLDRAITVSLPWNRLEKGDNTLTIFGPARALRKGVSALVRVHEAASGYHVLRSGAEWTCNRGELVVQADRSPAPQPHDNGPRRAIELRREFDLDAVPDRVRMSVTGLGSYEVSINGQRVGDELLAPGWTEFDERLDYATHDVTALLRPGQNVITAQLGNGWWSSGMGWESLGKASHPQQSFRLLMDLVAPDATGRFAERLAVTDAAWTWRPSLILQDTIYHGQRQDLRDNLEPWRPVSLIDDSYTPSLQPCMSEPIRVTDELEVKTIRQLEDGTWLYDFGQNHAGRPRLTVDVPAGTKLQLRHCEELEPNGDPYFENYRTAAVTDVVIAGDEPIDWSPSFTYRGYRYAILSGLPAGQKPDADTLRSQVLHNDVPSASRFRCSNELFNEIDHAVRWGLRSNMHSVPTDCPQRDERLGWTGDVQLFARTSCWINNLQQFYRKWLLDLTDAQGGDGGVPHVAPFMKQVLPDDSAPVWADIITVLPQVLHEFYDDRSTLEQLYEPMKKWVGWFEDRAVDWLALVGGFGDWVPVEKTPAELVGAAYFAFSSRIVAQVAGVLGHEHEAQRYARNAELAGAAFHKHYFDAEAGHYKPNTQTAQILPLMFDLTPPSLRQSVADHLAELVEARGAKPSTGFVGTAYLLPVLTRFGHHELAYRTLNTREYPSLGYMIDHGATTVWERWDSDKLGPDMNSRNHFCFGAMAQWMYEDLVGIKPDPEATGFRRVLLTPGPVGDLTFAEFTYTTPQGDIDIHWEVADDVLHYDVTLPPNVTAELCLPTADVKTIVAEGDHADATRSARKPDRETALGTCAVFELAAGTHRLRTRAKVSHSELAPAK
ncbi:MAG: family 78 glycoside hydrolase catalytic domain [Planctomycetota bacterium]